MSTTNKSNRRLRPRWSSIASVLIAVACPCFIPAAAAAAGWTIQTIPKPAGGTGLGLGSVSCPTEGMCMAVGAYNPPTVNVTARPLAELWRHGHWSLKQPPGLTDFSFLNAVSCTSPEACTAVGYTDSGNLLAEQWNGSVWKIQPIAVPGGQLTGVSCTSSRSCTAVGYDNTFAPLAEHWNGTAWTTEPPPSHSFLNAVSCSSRDACTAVGTYLKDRALVGLAERWNGTSWSLEPVPSPSDAGSFVGFAGVSCIAGDLCTAVGNYVTSGGAHLVLAERSMGPNWSVEDVPLPAGATAASLNGVSCPVASACLAAGSSSANNIQTLLAERWNGLRWSIEHIPGPSGAANSSLGGISCASVHACTAVGSAVDNAGEETLFAERYS